MGSEAWGSLFEGASTSGSRVTSRYRVLGLRVQVEGLGLLQGLRVKGKRYILEPYVRLKPSKADP